MTTALALFTADEGTLTDGGISSGAFNNPASATWTQPMFTSGGVADGNGSGTNDSIAVCTLSFGPNQTVTLTVSRPGNGDPGATELEAHTRMTITTGPDQVKSHEHDWTATILNIVRWNGNQSDFDILGGATVTEIIDGDVLKSTDTGPFNNAALEDFINGVSQATASDTSGNVPSTGHPGIGADNSNHGFFSTSWLATDGLSTPLVQYRLNPLIHNILGEVSGFPSQVKSSKAWW